ncbi:MAG: T9SS type A sorting domain-containing protein, partial [Candidatus Zixiibacteriota bacterium]
WQPLGSGMNRYVVSLTVYNGDLIAGGRFTTAGGIDANRVAAWDGSTWQPLGSGMNDRVTSLTAYKGELIAGGDFTTAGGKVSAYIAQWTKRAALTVSLDIKPGSCPNALNGVKHSKGKSVLPAAILATADFDVYDIDPESITLNGIGLLRWSYEDVSTPVDRSEDSCACTEDGPDGYEDLTLKFDRQAIISSLNSISTNQLGTTAASAKGTSSANYVSGNSNHSGPPLRASYVLRVEGQLKDGTDFEGYDCVVLMTKREAVTVALNETPRDLELIGNHPNPFNPVTEIRFYLPEAAHVKLEIFNVLGRRVATLADWVVEAGDHTVGWNGSNSASGVYLYRLTAGDYSESKKMLLLK